MTQISEELTEEKIKEKLGKPGFLKPVSMNAILTCLSWINLKNLKKTRVFCWCLIVQGYTKI